MKELAKQKNATPAQVVYRLVQIWGMVPLAGSTNEAYMKDGVETEFIPLTKEEIPDSIDLANRWK